MSVPTSDDEVDVGSSGFLGRALRKEVTPWGGRNMSLDDLGPLQPVGQPSRKRHPRSKFSEDMEGDNYDIGGSYTRIGPPSNPIRFAGFERTKERTEPRVTRSETRKRAKTAGNDDFDEESGSELTIIAPKPRRPINLKQLARNIPDVYSQMGIVMAMNELKIKESTSSCHSEFSRRMKTAEGAEKEIAKQHLQKTPPVSPTKYVFSALGASLTDKDWNTLIAKDIELHELGNSLAAIQQWWTTNRSEWVLHRENIRKRNYDIEHLRYQINEPRTTAFNQRSLQAQIRLREEEINNEFEWFRENTKQMDLVYTQFQKIRRRTDHLIIPTQAIPSQQPTHSYKWTDAVAARVNKWGPEDFNVWMKAARDDIWRRFPEIDRRQTVYKEEFDKLRLDKTMIQEELRNLRESGDKEDRDLEGSRMYKKSQTVPAAIPARFEEPTSATSLDDIVEFGSAADEGIEELQHMQESRASRMEEVEGKLNALCTNVAAFQQIVFIGDQRLIFHHRILGIVYDIIDILSISSNNETFPKGRKAQELKDLFDIYRLICLIMSRDHTAGHLAHLLADIARSGSLDPEDAKLVQTHFRAYPYTAIEQASLVPEGEDISFHNDFFLPWGAEWGKLNDVYQSIYQKAEELVGDLQTIFGDDTISIERASSPPKTKGKQRSGAASTKDQASRTLSGSAMTIDPAEGEWGAITTIEQARIILETPFHFLDTKHREATNTVYNALKDFICQPDINLYFRNLTSVPKPEILEHLNSVAGAHFMVEHLDAFLFDQNYNMIRFRVFGPFDGRVTSIREGWEFADEYCFDAGTIQRQIRYTVPKAAYQFARELIERRRRLPLKGPYRDVAELDLFHALHADGYMIDLVTLRSFLGFLTLKGTMFQYRIDKPDVLRRIDNGWDIKPHSRYTDRAILDNSLPPIRKRYPYLSALKSFMRSQTIQVRIAEALRRDPNGLRTVIQLMRLVSENQETWTLPSRNPRKPDYTIDYHWFYLWIRWVDERNLFFKVFRDQTIEFEPDGWRDLVVDTDRNGVQWTLKDVWAQYGKSA